MTYQLALAPSMGAASENMMTPNGQLIPDQDDQRKILERLETLARTLENCGLTPRVHYEVRAVDAYTRSTDGHDGRRSAMQRAVLRTHRGELWWWLLWPQEQFKSEIAEPQLEPLLPACETRDTARRIRNVLVLTAENATG